jgi:hypothetical protein
VDRDTVLADPYVRQELVRESLRAYRKIFDRIQAVDGKKRKRWMKLPEGNKAAFRKQLSAIWNAYEVEVCGIVARHACVNGGVANQCYIGGGSGWGGIQYGCQLLFRAAQPNDSQPSRGDNHVAIAIDPEVFLWTDHELLEALVPSQARSTAELKC